MVGIHQRQIRLGSRWHSVIFVGKARANTAFQPTRSASLRVRLNATVSRLVFSNASGKNRWPDK